MSESDTNESLEKKSVTRREFLKIAGTGFLAACVTGCTNINLSEISDSINKFEGSGNDPTLPPKPDKTSETVKKETMEPKKDSEIPLGTKEGETKNLENIISETREKYPYESFLYPVSKDRRLPESFPLNDCEAKLVNVDRLSIENSESNDSYSCVNVVTDLCEALTEMFNEARSVGHEPYVRSGFRSISTQKTLFEKNVSDLVSSTGVQRDVAVKIVNKASAMPGYSEHHTGFALDVLDMKFGNYTPGDNRAWQIARENYDRGLYGWLRQNAHKYGFVISYPAGETKNTAKENCGYESAEPWHLRFVGTGLAEYLYKKDYLNSKEKITLNSFLIEIEGHS